MKSVLISIQPKWCELITSGKKTVEIRTTRPKIETPFKCYIYETKAIYKPSGSNHLFNGEGKVIGEFICGEIRKIPNRDLIENFRRLTKDIIAPSCLTVQELKDYLGFKDGYGWHISDLVIYDKPKELSNFKVIEKTKCPAFLNRICLDRKQNDVIRCENLDCQYKQITRPPQSWCYVEGGAESGK